MTPTQTLDEAETDPFRGSIVTWAVGAVSLVAGLGATVVAVTAIGVSTLVARYPIAMPTFGSSTAKIEVALKGKKYALPRDGISAAEAGSLMAAPPDARFDWTPVCAEDVVPDSPIAQQLALRCLDHRVVFEATDRGLTLEERAHIEAHLDLPGIGVIEQLARARGYERPLDATFAAAEAAGKLPLAFEQPIPKFSDIRTSSYAMIALAGLLHDEGNSEEAEVVLREVISAGVLLMEDGETLIEGLIGAVMTRAGMEGLAQLYERVWRQPEAEDLRRELEAYENRDRRPTDRDKRSRQSAERRLAELKAVLGAESAPRGLRWEVLGVLGMEAACGNAEAMLFGSPTEPVVFQRARRDLVRSDASALRFGIARTTIERLSAKTRLGELDESRLLGGEIEPWEQLLAIPVELTAWVLQNPRIDGCFWAHRLTR